MNIVFDFGAVLINWRPMEVVRKHFPDFSATDEAAMQLARSFFAHPDWQEFDAGRLTPQQVSRLCANRLQLDVKAVQHMVDAIEDHITPITQSVNLLHELHDIKQEKGYELYYLSNMPVQYARGLERHAFMQCFKGGIFSGDVGLIKPQREIFHKLESMYGLNRESILFIDDHPDNIAAAKQIGWQTLHLTAPESLTPLLRAQLQLG